MDITALSAGAPVDNGLILTADAASREPALAEVLAAAAGARLVHWLAPGEGLVALATPWHAVAQRLRVDPPVFCRHICPVEITLPLTQTRSDLDTLIAAGVSFAARLDVNRPFSVQTRTLGRGWPYGPYDVNTPLAAQLQASGAPLNVRAPVDVLSVVLTPDRGYLGLSPATDNLSNWAGGARRFRRERGQISRAEFKLLEALEVFGLDPAGAQLALDLGAAPGGWTRVLRQHSAHVVAVDPAALVPALRRDPGVRHVRTLAQDYLATADTAFDIILNDMRMDARDSARLMSRAAAQLRPLGWAVMTLKLPKQETVATLAAALALLKGSYTPIGVRQLFHNRSEVTTALRRRG